MEQKTSESNFLSWSARTYFNHWLSSFFWWSSLLIYFDSISIGFHFDFISPHLFWLPTIPVGFHFSWSPFQLLSISISSLFICFDSIPFQLVSILISYLLISFDSIGFHLSSISCSSLLIYFDSFPFQLVERHRREDWEMNKGHLEAQDDVSAWTLWVGPYKIVKVGTFRPRGFHQFLTSNITPQMA